MKYQKDDIIEFTNNMEAMVMEELENYGVQYLYLGFIDKEKEILDGNYDIYRVDGQELNRVDDADEFNEIKEKLLAKMPNYSDEDIKKAYQIIYDEIKKASNNN